MAFKCLIARVGSQTREEAQGRRARTHLSAGETGQASPRGTCRLARPQALRGAGRGDETLARRELQTFLLPIFV